MGLNCCEPLGCCQRGSGSSGYRSLLSSMHVKGPREWVFVSGASLSTERPSRRNRNQPYGLGNEFGVRYGNARCGY